MKGSNPDRLLETIKSVHNLTELSQRPYTLRLISEFIPQIEKWQLEGRQVYGVTLYREMVRRWLERDAGKHHIHPDDKLELAAYMAHHLWVKGEGVLPANKLERWFHGWLGNDAALRQRYSSIRGDQLEEDLRTSTFLTRQDAVNGQALGFRFAHTSLLEFFLAQFLFQAVADNVPERWAITVPSTETLDFFGQMLAEHGQTSHFLNTLNSWRTSAPLLTRTLYLRYAFFTAERNWPTPALDGANFSGLDLAEMTFHPRGSTATLDFKGTSFKDAQLQLTKWRNTNLSGADFTGSDISNAQSHDCDCRNADFREARVVGTIYRHCRLSNSDWSVTTTYHPQFHACLDAPTYSGAVYARTPEEVPNAQLRMVLGAQVPIGIGAQAWSPDGLQLAVGGSTLMLLDALTGEPIFRETESINSFCNDVAWSPDGSRIATAGAYLRIIDPQSRAVLYQVNNHGRSFKTVAWSPDGTRIAITGPNLLVINAENKQVLNEFNDVDHATDLAWSPDNTRIGILYDDDLIVIDATTGGKVLTLSPETGITSFSWSIDGARIAVSGGQSHIYDAITGEIIKSGEARRYISHVEWSPDGKKIAVSGNGISILDAATLHQEWSYMTLDYYAGLSWSKDSIYPAVNGYSTTVINVKRQKAVWATPEHDYLFDFAWLPDSQNVAVSSHIAGGRGQITIVNATSGKISRNIVTDDLAYKFDWSPDGNQIVRGEFEDCVLTGIDGVVHYKFGNEAKGPSVRNVSWSTDGKQILVNSRSDVSVYCAANGQEQFKLSQLFAFIGKAKWSPDSARIAIVANNDKEKYILSILNVSNGEQLLAHSLPEWIRDLTWSPDGKHIALAGQHLYILNV